MNKKTSIIVTLLTQLAIEEVGESLQQLFLSKSQFNNGLTQSIMLIHLLEVTLLMKET